MRSQAFIRGLKLPKLGSPQDVYLQKVMLNECERNFTREAFQAYATWATGSGEGAKHFGELASESYGKLVKLFFPHIKVASSKDQQARQEFIVKRMFENANIPLPPEYQTKKVEEAIAEQPERKGFWRGMLEKLTGKSDT